MKKYDLTLIIPTYNNELYIDECLKSVATQKTKFSYQVIVVNDGSTDSTGEKIAKYSKYQHFMIITKKNGGVSSARNIGIQKAKGEYIGFLDGDDFVADNYIEKLVSIAKNEEADCVKTGHVVFCEKYQKDNKYESAIIKNLDNDKYSIRIDGFSPCGIFKKCIFEELKFPEGFWYEDIIMKTLVIPRCKKIVTIEESLYYYRINSYGFSRSTRRGRSKKCLDHLRLMEIIISEQRNNKYNIGKYVSAVNIHELTGMLWQRTRRLSSRTRRNSFKKLCIISEILDYTYEWVPFFERQAFRNILKKNYNLWYVFSFMANIKKRLLHG